MLYQYGRVTVGQAVGKLKSPFLAIRIQAEQSGIPVADSTLVCCKYVGVHVLRKDGALA